MVRISILNYGVGNLYSIQAALEREGAEVEITKEMGKNRDVDALVLPGVGSFNEAARKLPRKAILEMSESKPLLGICLGLQLFFESSDEGKGRGLSILPGRVRRLPSTVKVPQIGWNTLKIRNYCEFVDGIPDESWVYYVHSYYPETQGKWVSGTSEYGIEYATLVANGNMLGTQFHPEKSGRTGRMILQNFLRVVRK